MLYKFFRIFLFWFKPEFIHNLIFGILPFFKFLFPLLRPFYSFNDLANDFTVNGLRFRNRLGIAAGLDKNGELIEFWDTAGFSHIEVGTVTPLPQPGNPKPRLFRLVKDKGIINRMGFNNKGAEHIRKKILKAKKRTRKDFVIGVNIGKNKQTPLENAFEDYAKCLDTLYEAGDYFTINISSPNTEGLRELQGRKFLKDLLFEIIMKRNEIMKARNLPEKNIFLKIAPDLTDEEIKSIYEDSVYYGLNGIIATNTTITRDDLKTKIEEGGGLSGKPLKAMSDEVLKKLSELNRDKKDFILIGAGGVFNASDYKDKMLYGADLVQIYTGLIYEGFGIAKKILR
ncbi:MAG TPA: quinone-dependent dihydroorotate dehydrogenase [Ignavibacteria bacterium]|nr:quinone-dependent dihydroorotate dehydrogenase [Ignavibacteria bacterium]